MYSHVLDLRVGWRLLTREPLWSTAVIGGLAIGFAACFLLVGFIQQSLAYDRHVPQQERIFLVETRFHFPGVPEHWNVQAPLAIHKAVLESDLPATASIFAEMEVSARVGERVLALPFTIVDENFPAMFDPPVLAGDLRSTLQRPDAVALTQASAAKLFGTLQVIGRTLVIRGRVQTVTALLPTPPVTTTAHYEVLIGANSNIWQAADREEALSNWGRLFGRVYLKLASPATAPAIQQALQAASDRSPLHDRLPPEFLAQLGDRKLMDVKLVPLTDVYLDPGLANTAKPTEHGNRTGLWGLGAVALLILVLACVNYVNLAAVRTLRRQREIGIRKVLGASIGRVSGQFIGESVLITLLATATGLLLAWLVLPLFAEAMNRRLDGMFNASSLSVAIVFALLVGSIVGSYPAWVTRRVRPTQALVGRDNQETGSSWLRRMLTIGQFTIALCLTGLTLTISWQTWHTLQLDPGFDAESLLVIDIAPPFTPSGPRAAAFADAVAEVPGVAANALSMDAIGRNLVNQKVTAQRANGAATTLEKKGVGIGYFDVYGITPLSGRVFTRERDGDPLSQEIPKRVVLSATAARSLGFDTLATSLGQLIDIDGRGRDVEVVGVVPDVRHQTTRERSLPVVYSLSDSTPVMTVKVDGDVADVLRTIQNLWPSFFPEDALKMSRARTFLDSRNAEDVRLTKLLIASALLAVAIAALGIYVLTTYNMQRLTREIVIRKLHGAGRVAILKLASRELSLVVLASAVLFLPIVVPATQRYLAQFAERAPGMAWAVVLALALGSAVALAAAAHQIRLAVNLRPVLALKG